MTACGGLIRLLAEICKHVFEWRDEKWMCSLCKVPLSFVLLGRDEQKVASE